MMLFMLGFVFVQLCAWVFGTYFDAQKSIFLGSGTSARDFLLPVVLVPSVAAWVTAELASLLRRPRIMTPPPRGSTIRTWLLRAMLGTSVGMFQIALAGVLLRFNQEYFADLWVMAAAGAGSVLAIWAFLPRRKGNECPDCGYDWKGLARCPECGTLRAAHNVTADPGAVAPVAVGR